MEFCDGGDGNLLVSEAIFKNLTGIVDLLDPNHSVTKIEGVSWVYD